MSTDDRNDWLRRLHEECPTKSCCRIGEDDDVMAFLAERIGKFDMYVEDDDAVFIRYCFADSADAREFRRRFEQRLRDFKLAS